MMKDDMSIKEYHANCYRMFRTEVYVNRRLSAIEWLIERTTKSDWVIVQYLIEDALDMIDFAIKEAGYTGTCELDHGVRQRVEKLRSICNDMRNGDRSMIGQRIRF